MKPLPPLSLADRATLEAAMTPSARELVRVVGLDGVVALVAAYGGTRIFVHVEEPADSPIGQAIGAEAAARLGAFRGGQHFDVPLLSAVRRLMRDNAVRADFDAGSDVNALALRFELTGRHIRKVLGASIATSPRL